MSNQDLMSFTKLFSTITASTIWCEDNATRIVWVTMLAMADRNGYVAASVPGLAAIARVTVEEVETALEKFRSPDRYSRSKEHDGRRVADADGGWLLLNYSKYREQRDKEHRREQVAKAVKKHRETKRVSKRMITDDYGNQCKPRKAQAEAEREAELTPPTPPADLRDEITPVTRPHPLRLKPMLVDCVLAEYGKRGLPRQGCSDAQWLEACARVDDALSKKIFRDAQEACQALAKASVEESMRPGGKLGFSLLQSAFTAHVRPASAGPIRGLDAPDDV